ncbi:hypothetical protein [Kitasatospora sp. NPDC001095]
MGGARDDFEAMIGQLALALTPGVRIIAANPGDWGIDAFAGDLDGAVTVWQAKYFFPVTAGDSHRRQIRESFNAAVKAAREQGHAVQRWVLCVPSNMDGPTAKWWDDWKRRNEQAHGLVMELWDETALRARLLRPEADHVRRHYYDPFDGSPSSGLSDRKPTRSVARMVRRYGWLGILLALAIGAATTLWPSAGGDVHIQGRLIPACPEYYTLQAPGEAFVQAKGTNWAPWDGATLVASAPVKPVIEVTAQTSSHESVLLMGVRVSVVKRGPLPKQGIVLGQGGCGAGQDERPFDVDLDPTSPKVVAVQGTKPLTQFPFRIEAADPEVFVLNISDTLDECWFTIELDWVKQGEPGTTVVDDHGKPFHVMGAGGWPRYVPGGGPTAVGGLVLGS